MWTLPPRLRPRDRVRLLSLSGSFPRAAVRSARSFADPLGLKLQIGASVSQDPGYLGRDPRRRADDFNDAVADESVRGLLLFRGGNSAAETLRHLDFEALERTPKVVAGYSDHASVVLAVHTHARLVSFLVPPMLLDGPRARHLSIESFRRLVLDGERDVELPQAGSETWRAGRARGPLVASNLRVMCDLLGTPYFPRLGGAVLAWEEIGESIQDLNRMFTQLANAGAFERIAGMVVGHLEGVPRKEEGFTVRELLLRSYAGPILKTRAFGHSRPSFALPLGVRVELDAGARRLVLAGPAVDLR
jgi:muramoyltetrapeptide carboxypeptidase